MHFLRTPDERFEQLTDFPYPPSYVSVDAQDGTCDTLRMHYVDHGPGDKGVALLLHGEPSWSYLYRTMIPVLAEAGYRCIAPDLIGFGRSDKPAERGDYTYQRHVDWLREGLFDQLNLTEILLICQDWGGLLGLRLVAEHPERFAAVVAANTALPTGDDAMSDAFYGWQSYSQESPTFNIGRIVQGGCARPVSAEVVAAYDAPFPDDAFKAGARHFPVLVPTRPDDPASDANRRAWSALERFDKPFVCRFGEKDAITAGSDARMRASIPGAQGQPHDLVLDAGHFLQEDAGPELAESILGWVASSPA